MKKDYLVNMLDHFGFSKWAKMISHYNVKIVFEVEEGTLGSYHHASGRWGQHTIVVNPYLPSQLSKTVLLHELAHLINDLSTKGNTEKTAWDEDEDPLAAINGAYNSLLLKYPKLKYANQNQIEDFLLSVIADTEIKKESLDKSGFTGHDPKWVSIYSDLLYYAATVGYLDVDQLTEELREYKPYGASIIIKILQLPLDIDECDSYDLHDYFVSQLPSCLDD